MPLWASILIAVVSGGMGREVLRFLFRRKWGSNSDLWDELRATQKKLANTQRKLAKADRERLQWRELIGELEARLLQVTKELERSRADNSVLRSQNADQQRQINELREHIAKLETR